MAELQRKIFKEGVGIATVRYSTSCFGGVLLLTHYGGYDTGTGIILTPVVYSTIRYNTVDRLVFATSKVPIVVYEVFFVSFLLLFFAAVGRMALVVVVEMIMRG